MGSNQEPKEGCFYWAIPCAPFYASSDHRQVVQPAMCVGGGKWLWIGSEDDSWPAQWVGDEIKAPELLATPPQ